MNGIIGEIRAFAGDFAPVDWLICDGCLQAIRNFEPLFSLIGVTYGGDGVNTFALPDLRGRLIIGQGGGPNLTPRTLGVFGGAEAVTLTGDEMPLHTHAVKVSTVATGSVNNPSQDTYLGSVVAATGSAKMYVPQTTPETKIANMDDSTIQPSGGNYPHSNVMPCLAINYIICFNGVYPQQS
jgi:microcystin-dependent protein